MTRRINLALQGGGAHGAFTWGVLDRLLEEPDLEIAAISGTSAGALNGAALKAGLVAGGPEEAKANLDWLWGQVGAIQDLRLKSWMQALFPTPASIASAIQASFPFNFADSMTRILSPYSYGPFYRNPLRRIVDRFDYSRVCAHTGPALFISATNVRTGKIRVFEYEEISTDVILASACLPTIFQAVEIHDARSGQVEAFWDGGYTGNPALFPLFDPGLPEDVVIVNINPLYRPEVPVSPQDILNRINEVSFNSSLMRELRAIAFVRELIAEGKVPKGAMKNVLVHMIADDGLMRELSVATKIVPQPYVLNRLKSAGRQAADRFLAIEGKRIGQEGTIDLESMFG
jgi:NTE family protein